MTEKITYLAGNPDEEQDLSVDGRVYPDIWYNRDADPAGIDFLQPRWDNNCKPEIEADVENDIVHIAYESIVIDIDPELAREIGRAAARFDWLDE